MITVVGMWEPSFSEYEQIVEYRMWKQTIAAFEVDRWIMVGEGPSRVTSFQSFETMPEALETITAHKVFLIPEKGQELDFAFRSGDVAFIFGNADESLISFVGDKDEIAHIKTPKPVDMFAACVLPMVLSWP
jgi:hypothetical protein